MKIAHGVRWSVHASSFLWFFVDDLSSIGDRGSFAVPFRARLMPTKPAATSRSESFSVGFTFGPLLLFFFFFFVTGGGHTPRAFVPRSLSENIYLFTEPLSGDPLCFSGIHQSKCTCLSHTISLGQGIFRDIASAISSWLIASQIGNGKWMGFAIYLKTISSREFFISSFRLGGKTANSVSKSNSWNVTKDVHAVIEKSSFFRSYRT